MELDNDATKRYNSWLNQKHVELQAQNEKLGTEIQQLKELLSDRGIHLANSRIDLSMQREYGNCATATAHKQRTDSSKSNAANKSSKGGAGANNHRGAAYGTFDGKMPLQRYSNQRSAIRKATAFRESDDIKLDLLVFEEHDMELCDDDASWRADRLENPIDDEPSNDDNSYQKSTQGYASSQSDCSAAGDDASMLETASQCDLSLSSNGSPNGNGRYRATRKVDVIPLHQNTDGLIQVVNGPNPEEVRDRSALVPKPNKKPKNEKSELENHRRKACPKRFECTVCHKWFRKKGGLNLHSLIHTGEKPFRCDQPGCGQGFNQRGNLKRHERLHTGEKPFQCAYPGCEKRFTQGTSLAGHHMSHTGLKPFQCQHPGCSEKFIRKDYLVQHERKHER